MKRENIYWFVIVFVIYFFGSMLLIYLLEKERFLLQKDWIIILIICFLVSLGSAFFGPKVTYALKQRKEYLKKQKKDPKNP